MATELLRVAIVDGELVLDLRRRVTGRGAWIHPDPGCLAKAERRRAFPRALRVPGPLDADRVRRQLEQLDPGSSRISQETGKQVDPS
jgi:predicted RNA-binding protein YlxR (DUF448 family)